MNIISPAPARFHRRGRFLLITASAAVLLISIALVFLSLRIQPYIKNRVLVNLRARFGHDVELANLRVSLFPRIVVTGDGLTARLLAVRHFSFSTSIVELARPKNHIGTIFLQGLSIQIPPKSERAGNAKVSASSIEVDEILSEDATLTILPAKQGKLPLIFNIHSLKLTSAGSGKPVPFSAKLTNPKPLGDIDVSGHVGPWQSDDPGGTPISGDYSFNNADLSTTNGIAGTLSSQGRFNGTVEEIEVQGQTDTPDFRISSTGGHPVHLHTDFLATVDGTSGDTFLHPVRATFLNTAIVASGSVTRSPGIPGHMIALNVDIRNGRIEDILRLAIRSDRPALTGAVALRAKFYLPPGPRPVHQRLGLNGTFSLAAARFTSRDAQLKIDRLSLYAQGKPTLARERDVDDVFSNLHGSFTLGSGLVSFSRLTFNVPGAAIDLTGTYRLKDRDYDFYGHARFDAKLSQMTTGVKSILLRVVDPFFKKDGAGTVLPIRITGAESHPAFKVDLRKR